ncbi:hypothetical protein I350_07686 [Cryptococcus amylolentus CBS 6273]|uniref:Conserved oligomeric Golgi complex subunit 8 n=1 Tax=Cryptococcus amylolentus CBS 6273 TaxID=1296118 RepID=A0A1E3JB17_9TREE|nr:hypothetical protein I350_07686 [Cryptococcus amylolentus CBS 6273]
MEDPEAHQASLQDLLQSSTATDITSPAASSYLDHLLALPLPELTRQPSLISLESSTVESDLTNLCFREYPTFISVHKCSSAVKSAFDDFSGSLSKLIDSIPTLEEECRTFTNESGKIQRVRGKASLIQEHQDKLLDLLEIPQLMETCVRNGYYQEAMELLSHSRSLSERYKDISLVQDVVKEVDNVLQLMLAQLLTLLREPVKLPSLVKAVSFLRRLEAMNEVELGLVFIASRYRNYRTQLVHIERDKGDPVRYLRKYIDLFREYVYDIIAQVTTIFLDSPDSLPHVTAFASQAVTELVALVHSYVPRLSSDPASMSSILIQLGYCVMSFSRVGLDFAPLISGPFGETAMTSFSDSISSASTEFSALLRESSKTFAAPSKSLVVPDYIPFLVSSPSSPPSLPTNGEIIEVATHYPPFVTLINAHLTAFNNLRLLAPLSLHSQILALHSASLLSSTTALLAYLRHTSAHSEDAPPSPSIASSPTVAGPSGRPTHTRTPSAPRADLLRRNSEVLLTPEQRASRRREAKRVSVAAGHVWAKVVVPYLMDKLEEGVFGDEGAEVDTKQERVIEGELGKRLEQLESWVKENAEGLTLKEPAPRKEQREKEKEKDRAEVEENTLHEEPEEDVDMSRTLEEIEAIVGEEAPDTEAAKVEPASQQEGSISTPTAEPEASMTQAETPGRSLPEPVVPEAPVETVSTDSSVPDLPVSSTAPAATKPALSEGTSVETAGEVEAQDGEATDELVVKTTSPQKEVSEPEPGVKDVGIEASSPKAVDTEIAPVISATEPSEGKLPLNGTEITVKTPEPLSDLTSSGVEDTQKVAEDFPAEVPVAKENIPINSTSPAVEEAVVTKGEDSVPETVETKTGNVSAELAAERDETTMGPVNNGEEIKNSNTVEDSALETIPTSSIEEPSHAVGQGSEPVNPPRAEDEGQELVVTPSEALADSEPPTPATVDTSTSGQASENPSRAPSPEAGQSEAAAGGAGGGGGTKKKNKKKKKKGGK